MDFSAHCRKMLEERGIPLAWPERAFRDPDRTEERADGTRHDLKQVPVADLDAVVREIARVTAQGGRGHHCFPAKWLRVEPHWLPKNRLRHGWLRRRQRDRPQWRGHESLTPEQRIDAFDEDLNRTTDYRPLSRIRAAFEQAELKVQFGDVAAPDAIPPRHHAAGAPKKLPEALSG
jgi:hypothetical protein